MADLNNLSITGRLTKDAEFKTFASGSKLLEFDIANNTGFGDHARCNFFKVKCWNKGAENIKSFLVKGKEVAVTGELNIEEYTDRTGTKRQSITVTCFGITLLGGSGKSSAPNPDENSNFPEDIPF